MLLTKQKALAIVWQSFIFQAFSGSHVLFMMRHYEILTILPGTLAETDVPAVVSKIQAIIEGAGSTELKVEQGGKSRLAYPIKHIRYGYFHVFTFQGEAEVIKKIEEKLRLFGQILRTVIKTFDPTKRDTSVKQTMTSLLGIDEEKNEKDEMREEKTMKKSEVAPVKSPLKETQKIAEVSEEKPQDLNIQDFDKQLEAILDDKIAGL